MPKFRRKPTTVEAFLWTRNGDHPLDWADPREDFATGETISPDRLREEEWEGALVRYFRHPDFPQFQIHEACGRTWSEHGWIDTGRYGHTVCPGDWIIRDAVGEFYPCRPDVLVQSYEPLP